MTELATDPERALYATWEMQAFRSIERFSDYRKIKDRLRRTFSEGTAAQSNKPWWRFLLSNKVLTVVTAVGTVALVLIGVATIIIALR